MTWIAARPADEMKASQARARAIRDLLQAFQDLLEKEVHAAGGSPAFATKSDDVDAEHAQQIIRSVART